MSSKRKSFLLHFDSLSVLDDLSDEQAGKLFKAIKSHHFDEEIDLDSITKIAFSPFKNQFARDQEKYEITCKRRAEAGSKGGKQKQQNLANASKSKQGVANLADSDSKNKSDSDSDSDSDSKKEKNINTSQESKITCPHKEILKIWDEVMPNHLTRHNPDLWKNKPGYRNLKARWGEMQKVKNSSNENCYSTKEQGLDWWRRFLAHMSTSEFCVNGWRGFALESLIQKKNFYKAIEGGYHQ